MKPAAGCVFARSLTYGNFKIVFTSCFQPRHTLTANVVTMACTANAGRKREGKSTAIGSFLYQQGGGAVAVTADSRTALQARCIFNVFCGGGLQDSLRLLERREQEPNVDDAADQQLNDRGEGRRRKGGALHLIPFFSLLHKIILIIISISQISFFL